jgi:hypothetical protein
MLLGRLHNKLKFINMSNIENIRRQNNYSLIFYGFYLMVVVGCLANSS